MDDLVQHIVRELSFEGDLGKSFVRRLIGDHLAVPDPPHHVRVVGVRLSLLPFLFSWFSWWHL